MAKLYVKGGNLKHTIFDPNTAIPKINNDVTILKRFLAFKNNLRSSHRLELDEIDVQTFQYGKSDINRYEHHLWVNYWLYQDSHLRRIFHIPPRFLFTTHSRENEVNTFRLLTGGFRTFRHKTFRQQDGGRRFGNFLLPKRLWCRNVFTAGERRFGNKFSVLSPSNVGAYSVYARSPSPSQRPAPTTIASRSPFPLGLCSCSTSLSKMGI